MTGEVAVELRGIEKSFPGVKALKGVDFDIRAGEVHCLLGENGAGKSTLIKILAGAHQPDAGEIRIRDTLARIENAHHAHALGLAFIFQELDVLPMLSVADNITLGHESESLTWNRASAERVARTYLDALELDIRPHTLMRWLSPAERQLVMIARALSTNAAVIVMDEPTATLTRRETDHLFAVINRLKSRDVAVVYVSHRLEEIFRIGDRITVLRDGERMATLLRRNATREQVIGLMVGRSLASMYERTSRQKGQEALRLAGVSGYGGRVHDVDLTVHEGEVMGLGGLVGSGRTELVRLVFGVAPLEAGTIYLRGEPYQPTGPHDAIRHGIGLVPEERKAQGIVNVLSVRENISMASSREVARFGVIDRRKDRTLAERFRGLLNIRTPNVEQLVRFLSGGNQQKVVIAKWLATNSRILLLDEPTRGVDVGAKAEIFHIVDELAASGAGILMISSELEEVVAFCDRVAVMRDGTIAAMLEGSALTMERVMSVAA